MVELFVFYVCPAVCAMLWILKDYYGKDPNMDPTLQLFPDHDLEPNQSTVTVHNLNA
jgi:hypothetical protein